LAQRIVCWSKSTWYIRNTCDFKC